MQSQLLNNTELLDKLESLISKHSDIVDLLIFGSISKGKPSPNDIDFLLLFNGEVDRDTEYEVRKHIEKILPDKTIEITAVGYSELFKESFLPREEILTDGFSIRLRKSLSEGFGYVPYALFKYKPKNLKNSERIKFQYALYGRGKSEGLLSKLGGKKLSECLIICPIACEDEFKNFFKLWAVPYKQTKILAQKYMKQSF